jgi:hypothetical protein
MTEEEWLICTDPHGMLELLQTTGRANDRKLRLFAVACSRRIWALIDTLGRTAVEAAEKFADGLAGPEELRAARLACQGTGCQSAWYAAATNPAIAARNAARSAQAGIKDLIGSDAEELLAQADLLRDIFGPMPFRPLSINPAWLTPSVIELAQAIYDSRAYDRMPVLADAMAKARCTDAELLAHCRGPGRHVKGCWVVDLICGLTESA